MEKQTKEKVCVACGKTFLTKKGNKTCCSDECKRKRNIELTKERYHTEYKNKPKEDKPSAKTTRKRRTKVSVWEIEAEARKRGLSYGVYCALLQMENERKAHQMIAE